MRNITFEVTLENLELDVKKLYMIIRPEIKIEDIQFSEIKEGIVNSLVILDDAKSKNPIVIRTYSIKIRKFQTSKHQSQSFKFINRELELAVIEKASDLNITGKLIATYSNGFIYRYIDGHVNSLQAYDLETAKKVAAKLAKFHSIKLGIAGRKKPLVDMYSSINEDPYVIEKGKFNELMKQSDYDEFTSRLPLYLNLQKEYERLHNLILGRDGYGKVCLCHNDLTLTNILIESTTKEPYFIDFEMVNTNYQNYDIALHLLLLGGVFAKWFRSEDVPNKEFIKHFLRGYYEESNRADNQISDNEFSTFIDNELIKVQAIMLSIRILMIQRTLFHNYLFPGKLNKECVKDFCFSLYDDYVTKKDEHLRFLEQLNKK